MAKRSTQKISKRKNKTLKGGKRRMKKSQRSPPTNQTKSRIVKTFIELLNMVKLYHWKTRSYAKHKATDKLYESLNDHIDDFVEIMLGKDQSRIQMVEKRIDLLDASSNGEFKQRIHEYREFLIDLSLYFDARSDTDLLNSRDEILGDINQFLYLMSFDK